MAPIAHNYDLEERTKNFVKSIRDFIKPLPRSVSNFEYVKQLVRSSGSVAANYIEANEALSKKDFLMRIKICRKEAKETSLWLDVLETGNSPMLHQQCKVLYEESRAFCRIFGAIVTNATRGK